MIHFYYSNGGLRYFLLKLNIPLINPWIFEHGQNYNNIKNFKLKSSIVKVQIFRISIKKKETKFLDEVIMILEGAL